MRINIALVGGQAAPVFHVIDHYRPDRVVFIVSSQTLSTIGRILKECQAIGINDFCTIELDPTDPVKIAETATGLCSEYENDEVIVNISSGTKAWSHVFGYLFQGRKNAKVVYIDQNNKVYDFHSLSAEQYKGFEWERNFRLNKTLMKHTDFSSYDKRDIEAASKLYDFWKKKPDIMAELALLKGADKNTAKKKEGTIHFHKSNVEWMIGEDGICTFRISWVKNEEVKVFEVSSIHARDLAFNSGWSEVYVANLFQNWRKLHGMGDEGIRVNCVFPSQQNRPKNEVDVLVNAGQKALFVECKTKITKINDIDKFKSVTKNYGGLGSKGIFISFSEEDTSNLEKLDDNNLLFYSLKNDVKGLYALLDKELSIINAK